MKLSIAFCAALPFASLFAVTAPPTIGPAPRPSTALLEAGFRQMYNLEFDAARQTFASHKQRYPDDPMGPVATAAAYLFAEFDRMNILQSEFFVHDENFRGYHKALAPDPKAKQAFEAEVADAQRLAGRQLALNPNDTNALFASILALGLQSDYAGLIEKREYAAFSSMKRSRQTAERLLKLDTSFYDAYLAIGIENYMLSQRSLPMRWLLQLTGAQTDAGEGARRMMAVAAHGRYLQPFARLLLAVGALRKGDLGAARTLLTDLAREFPRNHLYSEELARLK